MVFRKLQKCCCFSQSLALSAAYFVCWLVGWSVHIPVPVKYWPIITVKNCFAIAIAKPLLILQLPTKDSIFVSLDLSYSAKQNIILFSRLILLHTMLLVWKTLALVPMEGTVSVSALWWLPMPKLVKMLGPALDGERQSCAVSSATITAGKSELQNFRNVGTPGAKTKSELYLLHILLYL